MFIAYTLQNGSLKPDLSKLVLVCVLGAGGGGGRNGLTEAESVVMEEDTPELSPLRESSCPWSKELLPTASPNIISQEVGGPAKPSFGVCLLVLLHKDFFLGQDLAGGQEQKAFPPSGGMEGRFHRARCPAPVSRHHPGWQHTVHSGSRNHTDLIRFCLKQACEDNNHNSSSA